MVTLARRASRIPFAPVVAVLFGVVAGVLTAATPQWLFERGIVASGLPALIAAASPPLGLMARLLAISGAFLAITVLLWAVLGPLTAKLESRVRARTPWRDAGYDVPLADTTLFIAARRPILAPEELGAPLMSDEAIAASAPDSIEPLDLTQFAVPAALRTSPEPLVSAATDNSIAALILRLEEGIARRAARRPDPDLPQPGASLAYAAGDADDEREPVSHDDQDDTTRESMALIRKMGRA